VIQKDGLNFVRLYFLNYTWYVNDLHNILKEEVLNFQISPLEQGWHRDVRRFLNESVPQRWIGRIGKEDLALQFWPPRSPDLIPCDFFLWGFVKEAVYVPSLPTTLDDLKNRITTAVKSVTQDILSSGVERIQLPSRCYRCGRRGGHIEHL